MGAALAAILKRADEREQGWFGCQDVGMALKGGAHFARYHAEHFRDLGYDLFTGSIRQTVRPVTDDTDA